MDEHFDKDEIILEKECDEIPWISYEEWKFEIEWRRNIAKHHAKTHAGIMKRLRNRKQFNNDTRYRNKI